MSPSKRHAKKQAKARQRRRLNTHERLARDRRQAQHAAEALHQAIEGLGLPEDLVAEIEGRLRSQHKLLGKIVGVMFPPCLGAVPTRNCAAYGAGTKICPRVCSVHSPNVPGSSGYGAWGWRCWRRYGVTPPAKVKPHAAAGNGPGWAMTQCSKSMASSWAWLAPGGAGRNTGYSPVLMVCCLSWWSAKVNWSSLSTLPSGGLTPQVLGRRAATNCTGCRACWMDAWRLSADAAWSCLLRWLWRIAGLAIRS